MPIDTRAKRQAAASFELPGAPTVFPNSVDSPFTRTYSASGYGFIGQTITLAAFTNTRLLGNPTLIQIPSGATGVRPYTYFIAGVDRSDYVDISTAVNGNAQVNSRATATFRTVDVTGGGYTPTEGDSVLIYEGTTLIYRGSITRTVEERLIKTAYPRVQVTCGDVGVQMGQRVVNAFYGLDLYGSPYFIVQDIVPKHLADLGINYVPRSDLADLTQIGDQLFYAITVVEVLNQLAKLMNADWVVDLNLNLRFVGIADAIVNGNSFTDSSGNWLEVLATRTLALEGNRIFAKSSAQLLQTQTDIFPGSPYGIYVMTYPPRDQTILPIVTVNGGANKIVVDILTAASGAAYDFYRVGTVVRQNPAHTALTSSDVVDITYPSPVPYVAVVDDSADIATNGLKEVILECGNITSKSDLLAIATAWLARLKDRATQLTVKTGSNVQGVTLAPAARDWQPGQLVSANFGSTGGATPVVDNFLVDSLGWQIKDATVRFQTLVLSNAQYQRTANAAKFLQDIIARLRTIALPQTQVMTLTQSTDLGTGFVLNVDQQINLDSTNGPFTVTLPPASSMYGKRISWMKISADSNVITIVGAVVNSVQQLINGQASQTISTQYQSAITEGNQWQ